MRKRLLKEGVLYGDYLHRESYCRELQLLLIEVFLYDWVTCIYLYQKAS